MKLEIMRWQNLHNPEGEQQALEWPELVALLCAVAPYRGADQHPGWSPTRCDPPRRGLEHVRRVYALCLDHDDGQTLEGAREALKGFGGVIHTTRKHTAAAHRFRVVLPLRRPVSPFEFGALWRRFNAHLDGVIDQAPKDPSRFWFLPGIPPEGEFESFELTGDWLDPDEWLAKSEPAQARPAHTRPLDRPSDDRERRAAAYVERMPAAISGSGGHQATWAVARKCAADFELDERATLRVLRVYNTRCQPPWSDRELEHKARQAVEKARVRNPVDDRHWDMPTPTGGKLVDDQDAPDRADPESEDSGVPEAPAFLSMRDLFALVTEELRKPKPERGIMMGFPRLDNAIGGMRRGLVTIVGAKRGFGKTSFGNAVVANVIAEHDVALFAGEDAALVYAKRFLARAADLNALRLRDLEEPTREEWQRIMAATASAPPRPFLCPVLGRPVEWIAEQIRALGASPNPPRLVVVDYLQCLTVRQRQQDRRNEVTHILRTLINAIRSVDASGLLFSQLRRGSNEEPGIEDLKESGDIEDGGDHIFLGWKEDGDPDRKIKARRFVKLAKNKDGQDASDFRRVELYFDARTASFTGEVQRTNGYEDLEQSCDDDSETRYP